MTTYITNDDTGKTISCLTDMQVVLNAGGSAPPFDKNFIVKIINQSSSNTVNISSDGNYPTPGPGFIGYDPDTSKTSSIHLLKENDMVELMYNTVDNSFYVTDSRSALSLDTTPKIKGFLFNKATTVSCAAKASTTLPLGGEFKDFNIFSDYSHHMLSPGKAIIIQDATTAFLTQITFGVDIDIPSGVVNDTPLPDIGKQITLRLQNMTTNEIYCAVNRSTSEGRMTGVATKIRLQGTCVVENPISTNVQLSLIVDNPFGSSPIIMSNGLLMFNRFSNSGFTTATYQA